MTAVPERSRDHVTTGGGNDDVEENVRCRFDQYRIEIRTDSRVCDIELRRERTSELGIHVDEPDDPYCRLELGVRGDRLEPAFGHSSAPAQNCAQNHYSPPTAFVSGLSQSP